MIINRALSIKGTVLVVQVTLVNLEVSGQSKHLQRNINQCLTLPIQVNTNEYKINITPGTRLINTTPTRLAVFVHQYRI